MLDSTETDLTPTNAFPTLRSAAKQILDSLTYQDKVQWSHSGLVFPAFFEGAHHVYYVYYVHFKGKKLQIQKLEMLYSQDYDGFVGGLYNAEGVSLAKGTFHDFTTAEQHLYVC